MINRLLLCLLSTAALWSCGSPQQAATQQTETQQDVPQDGTATDTGTEADTVIAERTDDTLRAVLTKASPVMLNAYVDSLHATVLCAVQASEPGTLTANLITPGDTGNIRFSQIYWPDGSTDGPFNRSLTYKVTQRGTFRFRITHSQMANDPYRGKFSVRLKLN